MKNRTTKDQRAMQSNGMLSHPRMIIIEALEAQTSEGATIDELVELIGADLDVTHPKMSIGSTLSKMGNDGYVVCHRNRWYLKEHFVKAEAAPDATVKILSQSNGKIAPMVQKRSGKQVSIFTSPRELNDVVRVSLVIHGTKFPVPLWGDMWICYGQSTPDWDIEKETYYNVETIELLLKNGTKHEEHPSPSDNVTIAQG